MREGKNPKTKYILLGEPEKTTLGKEKEKHAFVQSS